ncbi:MAG: ABC transporter permease [Longimicrobiales bacterium]
MNPRDIWILYTMEIRSAVRERAIVVNSILMPIFLYPVLLWVMFSAMSFIQGVNEGFTSRIALVEGPPDGHAELVDSLEARPDFHLFREYEADEATRMIRAGELDALLKFESAGEAGDALPGNFRAEVRYDAAENRSQIARGRIQEVVDAYRALWTRKEARALGLSRPDRVLFEVANEDSSTEEDLGALILGMLIPLFLTIMVALGCFYPAVDTTAGERERSTWETLMTTSASRASVVTAKYLYVATTGVVAGALNVLAIFISIGAVMAPLMEEMGDVSFRLPLLAIPVMILGAGVLALMFSAGMMILAAFARSFKDGQAMVQPVYFVALIIPLLLGQQTDQTLTPAIAALPVANVAMMIRDAINGIFLWPLIVQSLLVDLVVVLILLAIARFILRFEDFLTGSFDGSFWRFAKDRMRPGGAGKETT